MISSRSDIQTAIISCVLSFLPDSPSVPLMNEWKRVWRYDHSVCASYFLSPPSALRMDIHIHRDVYIWKHTASGRIGYWQTMVGPEKYGLWDAEKRNGFGENLSCFRSLEEHSLREAIECYRITRGASPGTDSSHAYLWITSGHTQ